MSAEIDSERIDVELFEHANTSINPSALAALKQAINIVKIKTNFFIQIARLKFLQMYVI